MSPNDHQKPGEAPRPFFSNDSAEAAEEATGLFDPRPQDVRPWALFERQPVISDALQGDAPEDAQAEASEPGPLEAEGESPEGGVSGETEQELELGPEAPESSEAPAEVEDEADEMVDSSLNDETPSELDVEMSASETPEGDEVGAILDETLAEPDEPAVEEPCPNCEATEAAAEATIDATIEALQLPYLEGSEALQRAAQDVSKDFMQNLLRLSVELAATVLRRSAEIDPETILSSLEGALEIAGPLSEATVRCHPEDAPLLREQAVARAEAITGRLVEVAVRPTEGMERGACVVDFEDGLVDARWRVQLERLADAISPALIHHAAESAALIVEETMGQSEDALDERADGAAQPSAQPEAGLTAADEEELSPAETEGGEAELTEESTLEESDEPQEDSQ